MAKSTYFSSAVLAVAASATACVPPGDGRAPPAENIYFPVSLQMSRSGTLLVVNSDFDLQFSQGTVQSLDLERIVEVTQRPCNADADCDGDAVCDDQPSEDNGNSPSYVCVDAEDPRPCGPFEEKSVSDRALSPGRCAPVDLGEPQDGGRSLLVDVAETSAFATEGLLLSRPCSSEELGTVPCPDGASEKDRVQPRSGEAYPERLFVPVRGDTTIHFLDVKADGTFSCGRPIESSSKGFESAEKDRLRCDDRHRIQKGTTFGLDAEGNFVKTKQPPRPGDLNPVELDRLENDPDNEFRLQPEPIDLAASAGGRVIVVSHQVGGMVSTLMNDWIDRPALIHVLRDLPPNPLGVASIPRVREPGVVAYEYEATWNFLLSYRSTAQVDLLHFDDDGLLQGALKAPSDQGEEAVEIFRPQMTRSASTPITTNFSGTHSRGLVVDDRGLLEEIRACGGDAACEQKAKAGPMAVYAANRSPSSLLIGVTGGESQVARASLAPRFFNTIPLSSGPSRIVLGSVIDENGKLAPRVFIICFDSALIYVFDPVREVVESVLRTGRGPYSLAFNLDAGVVYVGHFTDSYIGVISIDQRFPFTYGATLATLGRPKAPRAQK